MTDSPAPAPSPLGRSITWLVAFVVWALWAWAMQDGNRWGLFRTEYYMSITMVFGAFIAGATSEGGGAVAFPVMTLIFAIQPVVARDFSLMIQSVGMGAAALTILMGGIPIERRAAVWASLGGAIGVLIGIEYVAPLLQPKFAKMTFLSIWLSFAFALYWINRHQDREVRESIEHFGARHGVLLVGTGLIGGIVSGITGSGLDILTFSLLVLRFRICERIATPTSVVLMGLNAIIGFAWRGGVRGQLSPDAWNFWWVCVPIVVVCAPMGARFIRNKSRLFVAAILYASIGIQFVAGLIIIKQTTALLLYSAAVFATGLFLFNRMAAGGVRRLEWLASHPEGGLTPPNHPRQ